MKRASVSTLGKLIAVMDGLFPLLEVLVLVAQYHDEDEDDIDNDEQNCPRLPQTFQAPNLCHLDLVRVGDVVEPQLPLLAPFSGLVSLGLMGIPVSIYLPMEYLVSRLSLMPQLEYLCLEFTFYIPSDDIEGDLVDSPTAARILLPNLNDISFKGDSTYLEGLAARISAPLLTTFSAAFLTKPSSTLPRLSELLSATERLRFPAASITFSGWRAEDPSMTICMAGSEECLDGSPEFVPF
ncbi:hypothetical protein BJV78DRAFT_724832 [Lactifluus subvellereus]|nr:hypothetical protein BJV78DRAFT_724832 [Lactifluus subvellereus]